MALDRRWAALLVPAALLILGCSEDPGRAAGQPEPAPGEGQDEVRPLCPQCTAVGGETGDFTGGEQPVQTCPRYGLVPVEDGEVIGSGLSASAATRLVQRELTLPAVWRDIDTSDYLQRLGGFSEQTVLRASIEVTGVNRLEPIEELDWPGDAVAEAACDGLMLGVRVSIETEDGAILGRFDAGEAQVYSETEAVLRATADVKQFDGRLRLNRPAGARIVERLELYMSARGDRARMSTGTLPGGPVADSDGFSEFLELRAPGDDGCGVHMFMYSDQAEVRARTADIVSALAAGSPTGARHRIPQLRMQAEDAGVTFGDGLIYQGGPDAGPSDPGGTFVSVHLGSPTAVCQGRWSNVERRTSWQDVAFDVPAHLVADDGSYDFGFVMRAHTLRRADGSILFASGSFDSGPLPVAEFRERFGVDVVGSGSDCASLDVDYPNSSSGLLAVYGGPCDPDGFSRESTALRALGE